MLLLKDKVVENVQFLERVAINMFNLNLVTKALALLEHFKVDFQLQQRIKLLFIRLDFMYKPSSKQPSKEAYTNIKQIIEELRGAYPLLSLFLDRINNWVDISEQLSLSVKTSSSSLNDKILE